MTNSKPTASIIITAYNNAPTIRSSLLALGNDEPCDEFEVIIADDGSHDKIAAMIEVEATRFLFSLRHVSQSDLGFRAAAIRNEALRHSRGRIVIFVDGDIVIDRPAVQAHINHHRDRQHLLVVGSRDWYGPLGSGAFSSMVEKACSLSSSLTSSLRSMVPRSKDTIRREAREKRFRRIAQASIHPWQSFYSGHASATNSSDLFFDENFIGWGGEDWELAYRLMTTHGWRLEHNENISLLHIDLYGRPCNPYRTGDSEAIECFLRNVCRLALKWPATIDSGILEAFAKFHYDRVICRWKRKSPCQPIDAPLIMYVTSMIESTPLCTTSEGKAFLDLYPTQR